MITIRLLCVILLSVSAWAASYTATSSGNWAVTSTWGNSGPPGDGDTITINDGVTVTVSDARIIGTSGANGTIAVNTSNSGALVIALGGQLQVRGDVQYSVGGGANTTAYLIVQAGGIFEWNSSLAVSPATTQYTAHPDGAYGFRLFITTGTATSHAIVRSNAGGGNGYWRLQGANIGGGYLLQYTDFLRIGDAVNPAFSIKSFSDHSNSTPWDATHNTFTSCGIAPNGGDVGGEAVWRHSHNVHTGSLGSQILSRPGSSDTSHLCIYKGFPAGCLSGGIREMNANVFDIRTDTNFDATDFTIHSNYFADRLGICISCAPFHTWWYFQNNFYRVPVSDSEFMYLMGDSRDNFWLLDEPISNNPHGTVPGAASGQTMSGEIVDHAGQITQSISAFFILGSTSPSNAYALKDSILLPNASGTASFWLASMLQGAGSTYTLSVDHNTAIMTTGSTGVYTAHGTTPAPNNPGQLSSYRDNILWNPVAGDQPYKLQAYLHWNMDVCAPAMCDYNDGFNTTSGGGGFTNGGNGYADNFSSTPGQNDLSVDPMFTDSTRNMATFDSAYLGNAQPAWDSGTSYNPGDMVSSTDAALWNGAVVNYRYTNGSYAGTSCGSANPKPGLFTATARACWEWATLFRVREAVASQTLFDDQTIGAHGVDLINVLILWIRAGFSPRNPLLALAGHDGSDLGAVPVTWAAAQFAAPTAATPGSIVRGAIIRGGIR